MDFNVIDYSGRYFPSSLPAKRGGKFILVLSEDSEYLVMSPREQSTFHANIVERFFSELGISGRYNHKRDSYSISHTSWEIMGGGHWEIDENSCFLTLSGTSMAYGRFHSPGLARKVEKALPDLKVKIKS